MDQVVIPENCKAGLAKIIANGSFAGKPQAEQNAIIQDTLDRALADERLEDIAQSHGLPRTVLNYNLIRLAGDEWKDTQAARALTECQEAEKEIDCAEDVLSLARAREKLKSAQWKLERLLRRLYGDSPQIVINQGVTMDQALDGMAQKLLAKMRVVNEEKQE